MAIDTAAKRLASLDFEEVWSEALPIPDNATSAFDRGHGIWNYSIIIVVTIIFGNACLIDALIHNAILSNLANHDTILIDEPTNNASAEDEFFTC